MYHCLRIQLSIVTSALILIVGCSRQNRGGNFVRLAVTGRAAATYLPLYAAGPAGCFDQQGIQVRLDETPGSAKSLEALLGGSVDAAATDYAALLNVVGNKQPVRGFVLIENLPGFAAVISPKASGPIHKVEDLRGRTIGVVARGGIFQRVFDYMLLVHGVKPQEVSVVAVGSGLSVASALERGVVDVGLGGGLTISYLERRYPLRFLFDTRTPASAKAALGVEELASIVLCARTDWLEARPQTARRLAAATRCALTWVQDHTPQEIRKILPESSLSADAEADYEWIAATKTMLTTDGRMTAQAHAAAVRILDPEGSHAFKEQDIFTNEFLKP